ncbi:MAG TPA: hypothetical protein VFU15_07975 [Bacteroidia bacterium]|nr:hypothetical protein [Bacteroidia bacterium]
MNFTRGFLALGFIGVLYFGCKPQPVFPVEPALTFKEYQQKEGGDTLKVVFSFTDGDGDIGVLPTGSDTNMVLTAYYKTPAGNYHVWLNPQQTDSIYYSYRIPKLTASQKGLEGDIYLTISTREVIAAYHDTLEFNAFLLDQSGHKSNLVRTPELILLP